jgi:hypothetical protein
MSGTRWLLLWITVAAALLIIGYWFTTADNEAVVEGREQNTPSSRTPLPSAPPKHTLAQSEEARKGSPLAAELNAPDQPPQRDVEVLRELATQYFTTMQRRLGPPVGDDADLARVLTGSNPLRLVVVPPGHPAVTSDGRLVDRWGTPYHVHALSAQRLEFRSAGPDRRLFTEDDLVAR